MIASKIVRCPKCGKMGKYSSENEARPFCSVVCKNEDVISWMNEDYTFPTEEVDDGE